MISISSGRTRWTTRLALTLGASVTSLVPVALQAAECNTAAVQAMAPAGTTILAAIPEAQPVAHCRVEGFVITRDPGPNRVNFRVQLPDENWNNRFYFIGLGATAGYVPTTSQIPAGNPLVQGYAVAGTDTGQQNTADWSFFGRDPAQALDHNHRGAHVSTVAAQQITRQYYDADKMYRYHSGCSGGGRMGMQAMTMHPEDYDGILLGAPGLGPTFGAETMLDFIYVGQQMIREPGAWLSPAKLAMVDEKVTAHCDPLDGATDGIVWDRSKCTYDFEQLQCEAEDGPNCLTGPELRSIEALLRGPRSPNGPIKNGWPITNMSVWSGFIGGPPPWPDPMRLDSLNPEGMRAIPTGYYMGNSLARAFFGDDFEGYRDFDFSDQDQVDAWWAGTERTGFGKPFNDDLNPFRAAGGKVIFWNGVSDACCHDSDLASYFNSAGRKVGGIEQLQRFARLYKIPGMAHCGGGTGPQDAPDQLLSALVEWVEQDKAPEGVVTHRGDRAKSAFADPRTGTVSGVVVPPSTGTARDFLLCPYPQSAKFNGQRGGEMDAENWSCS